MTVTSNAPGVQFYTGNYLDGIKGKGGAQYHQHSGFCLETQTFPDSINAVPGSAVSQVCFLDPTRCILMAVNAVEIHSHTAALVQLCFIFDLAGRYKNPPARPNLHAQVGLPLLHSLSRLRPRNPGSCARCRGDADHPNGRF